MNRAQKIIPMLQQLDVVFQLVEGRDVFAVLLTWFGKSLCQACLPSMFNKILKKNGMFYHCGGAY